MISVIMATTTPTRVGVEALTGFELLAEVQKEPKLRDMPIIVFTGRELSDIEETELRKKAKSIVRQVALEQSGVHTVAAVDVKAPQ